MTAILTNREAQRHSDAGMQQRGLEAGVRPWLWDLSAFVLLVGSGVALRLACQDLPNFAPVAALALVSGYFFRSAILALCVPLAVMGISDWFVGGYHWGVMAVVYAVLAFPVLLRSWLRGTFELRGRRPAQRLVPLAGLIACGLFSSLVFFVVTNFAVWVAFDTYAMSWSGLAHCYAAAVPFFRYTLAGDLFFGLVLFGTYALALSAVRSPEPLGELS
ncbi:MAG: hypothetical protein MUF48_04335 [Pirellulaceae bacterium]|jgi:hypothetical protein|nr:hypothetical protein [Pirellulaceae bacterium]